MQQGCVLVRGAVTFQSGEVGPDVLILVFVSDKLLFRSLLLKCVSRTGFAKISEGF